MRTHALIGIIALILFALPALAQSGATGCCCDSAGDAQTGSLQAQSQCDTAHPVFLTVTAQDLFGVSAEDQAVFCDAKCAQNAGVTPERCGDGDIQPPEQCDDGNTDSGDGCSATCLDEGGPVSVGCDAPGAAPAVQSLAARPVRGDRRIRLTFTVPCAADYLNVSRCTGAGCTNFTLIALLPSTGIYEDIDPALEWGRNYTYKITARYRTTGDSPAATALASPGDIECWGRTDTNRFCLGYNFYEGFRDYLQQFGYLHFPRQDFIADFRAAATAVFGNRFGRDTWCDDLNRVQAPTVQCLNGSVCITNGVTSRCQTTGPCDTGGDPFSMFFSAASCEANASGPKYCFFDRSRSSINDCYQCNPRMSCYDYKTRRSCEADNCGAGACQWRPTFDLLGLGVCIDTRINNCPFCHTGGSGFVRTVNSTSRVFDGCSASKAAALSTPQYPCFVRQAPNGTPEGNSCDTAICPDFDIDRCGTPAGGIRLDTDNRVITRSADPCGIGICHYTAATGCIKNGDGNDPFQIGWQDCAAGDTRCERDYLPPETLMVAVGASGRHDNLFIQINDKTERNGSLKVIPAGAPNYTTSFCIAAVGQTCANYSITVNVSAVRIKDLTLRVGNRTVARLPSQGTYVARYTSKDAAKNIEAVQNATFRVCNNCSPPICSGPNVTPGRQFGNQLFARSAQPQLSIDCGEPVNVTLASVVRGGFLVNLTKLDPPFSTDAPRFGTPTALADNMYNYTINAHDNKTLYLDTPLQGTLVIDTVPPTVVISPADGSAFDRNSVDITLNFSEKVIIDSLELAEEVFISPFVKNATIIDLLNITKTRDNQSYTVQSRSLQAGRHVLRVRAGDFAGNEITALSAFYIATAPTSIRLAYPRFGVAPAFTFNVTVETSNPAECRYSFNTPSAPSAASFIFLPAMSNTSPSLHVIRDFRGIPPGDFSEHPLHVLCKDRIGTSVKSFTLRVDNTPPTIISADASPNPVVERALPEQDLFATNLRVQLSEQGFCKHSENSTDPDRMTPFPGYETDPRTGLIAPYNLTSLGTHTIHIVCENIAGLRAPLRDVSVGVDLNAPFTITRVTPPVVNDTRFTLAVDTNKKALCYFGETNTSITTCFGDCSFSNSHAQQVTIPDEGMSATFWVKCSAASGEEGMIAVDVIVDDIPPTVTFVNDSSNYKPNRELSYFTDQIRVAVTGNDTGSGISQYRLSVLEKQSRAEVLNATSPVTDGSFVWLNKGGAPFLRNGTAYIISAIAVDAGGLESFPKESDGVTIDTSLRPPFCDNEVFDPENETDVDCGGVCGNKCGTDQACDVATDCASGICQGGRCAAPSCDDTVLSPNHESDVGCGKSCPDCKDGKKCSQDNDCESDSCRNGVCAPAGPCDDKKITPGSSETDVDCGGSCPGCRESKSCRSEADCQLDLFCIDFRCTLANDEDGDGVPDDYDKCPGTALSATVNRDGCSDAQLDADGDGMPNDWEIQYGLDPNDASDAAGDPDDDGLTNLQEYRYRTDPTNWDTDGDRWSDGDEIDEGTDPLDPESHPESLWPLILLILLVLIGIGALGYVYYRHRQDLAAKLAKKPAAKPVYKPAPKKISPEAKARLSDFARKEHLPGGYTALELVADLVKRGVIKAGDIPESLRRKLEALARGELAEVDIMELIRILSKDPLLWEKLRKIVQRERAAYTARQAAKGR